MMTEFEELIREAALKNGYPLEKSDSLMVLATVMNRLSEDWLRTLDAALEKHRDEHEELARRWRKSATVQAEKILNAALDASREALAKGMNEGAEKVTGLVRGQVEDVLHAALVEQKAELALAAEKFRLYARSMLWGCGAAMLLALIVAAWL
jgi:hypothetical protein